LVILFWYGPMLKQKGFSMANNLDTKVDARIDWVEPEVRSLAIVDTAVLPGDSGHDGETIWTDCTLS